jgi:hypothetical protein
VKDLFEKLLSGFKGAIRKSDGIPPELGRDDGRASLLSIVGTVLLSAACLIVLWLQWERASCVEGRAASDPCFSDARPENTRAPDGHRQTVDEMSAPPKNC